MRVTRTLKSAQTHAAEPNEAAELIRQSSAKLVKLMVSIAKGARMSVFMEPV